MAKEPRRWTQAEVERVLAVSEDWERELEEERDVVKALQVRLVLEDAARLGSEGRATMRDELERYSEYRKYADAGVRAAWHARLRGSTLRCTRTTSASGRAPSTPCGRRCPPRTSERGSPLSWVFVSEASPRASHPQLATF